MRDGSSFEALRQLFVLLKTVHLEWCYDGEYGPHCLCSQHGDRRRGLQEPDTQGNFHPLRRSGDQASTSDRVGILGPGGGGRGQRRDNIEPISDMREGGRKSKGSRMQVGGKLDEGVKRGFVDESKGASDTRKRKRSTRGCVVSLNAFGRRCFIRELSGCTIYTSVQKASGCSFRFLVPLLRTDWPLVRLHVFFCISEC